MRKRIIPLFIYFISLNIYAACILPRAMEDDATKSAGKIFLDNGKFATREAAIAAAAAKIPPVILSEDDLCYGFAPKWGNDRFIEKGSRLGWCQIELFVDLNYKSYTAIEKSGYANPSIQSDVDRDIYDREAGIDWPMQDCSSVPPTCVSGFSALRTSTFMKNSTSSGIVNGDKTVIVQNWTCIKI